MRVRVPALQTDLRWEGSNLGGNQDEARQRLVNWVNANGKTCTAFDFPTKGILQEAVKKTEYWRLKDGNVSLSAFNLGVEGGGSVEAHGGSAWVGVACGGPVDGIQPHSGCRDGWNVQQRTRA